MWLAVAVSVDSIKDPDQYFRIKIAWYKLVLVNFLVYVNVVKSGCHWSHYAY